MKTIVKTIVKTCGKHITLPPHARTRLGLLLVLSLAGLSFISRSASAPQAVAPPAAAPGRTQHLTSPGQVPQGLTASDWGSIRAAYQASRHAVQPSANQPNQWLAWNPEQQWYTRFDARGFLKIGRASCRERVYSSV